MDCLAILDSGNYAYRLCRILEQKGYVFEVIAAPCQLARDGCDYCLKFPIEYKDIVVEEGLKNKIPVRRLYAIKPMFSKVKYEKIF